MPQQNSYTPTPITFASWGSPISISGGDYITDLDDAVNTIITDSPQSLTEFINAELAKLPNYFTTELEAIHADVAYNGQIYVALSKAWAEGTEPAGAGTKSSREYSVEAAGSAGSAAASALSASNSQTAAAGSASAAAGSASAAASAEGVATTKAAEAVVSAGESATSATAAEASKINADAAAAAAIVAEGNAENSKDVAIDAADAAGASAAAASTSETNAAASEAGAAAATDAQINSMFSYDSATKTLTITL